jgi:WD40 repeat protein
MSHGSDTGRPGEFGGARPPVVPEHTLVRCVGAGSYGQVWLARSVLGTWRAVKVVHRHLFQEDRPYEREFLGVQRFEPLSREDEGFVDILQTGRNDEGGYFYYVMELADDAHTPAGEWNGDVATYEPHTLSRILAEQRRLPLDACIELGWVLCRALGRLHEAGLIHRDVKPSNVIYVAGRPRLADIGLVVEQGEARSWVGTEGFIPPEGPNSPQSDLYSLGKVLYGAATGLDRADFPRLPLHTGTGVDGARFLELNAILLRACAASVQARYATAAAMESDLQLLRSGGSVRQRRRRQTRRRVLAGIAVVTLLVGAVIAVGVANRASRRAQSSAVPSAPGNPPARSRSLSAEWIGEGMRRMAADDASAALLYFTEALSAATVAGEPTDVLRLRIGVLRDRIPQLVSVIDAGGEVFSVDFGPDGRLVATADRNGAVTVWDVTTGRPMHGPHSPSGVAMGVRITLDGRRLLLVPESRFPALRGVDKPMGTARVLDIATGLPVEPEINDVIWGTFSPDGRWLASIGKGNRIQVHSVVDSGAPLELEGHPQPVSWMAFSPTGSVLASVSTDGTARLWNVTNGTAMSEPLAIGGAGMMVDFNPDGTWLATLALDANRDSIVKLWDGDSMSTPLATTRIRDGTIALDSGILGGRHVLVSGAKGSLSLRNVDEGLTEWVTLRSGKGRCTSWDVSADGRCAAVGTEDGSVRVWDAARGRPMTPALRHPETVRFLAMSRTGERLLTVTGGRILRVWKVDGSADDLESVEVMGNLARHQVPYLPYPIGLTAEGQQLVFPVQRKDAAVPVPICLDPLTGREESLPLQADDPACVALATGRHAPVVAFHSLSKGTSNHGVVLLRRVETIWSRSLLPHPMVVNQMVFADGDKTLWTLDAGNVLRGWNVRDGTCATQRRIPTDNLEETLISSDGTAISADGKQVSWIGPMADELCTQDILGGPVQRRFRLPPTLAGRAYYLRPYFLATATAHWPTGDPTVLVANYPFPAAALAGVQIKDVHPTSDRILALSGTGSAKLLDLKKQIEIPLVAESESTPVAEVRFDPAGRFVIAVGTEGGVSVYDARLGELIVPWSTHPDGVRWATITPQGMLIMGYAQNQIRRSPLRPAVESPEELRAQAEALAGRRLDDRGQLAWLTGSNLVQRLR